MAGICAWSKVNGLSKNKSKKINNKWGGGRGGREEKSELLAVVELRTTCNVYLFSSSMASGSKDAEAIGLVSRNNAL